MLVIETLDVYSFAEAQRESKLMLIFKQERFSNRSVTVPETLGDKLKNRLAIETTIPNWTAAKGLLGDSFTAVSTGQKYVEVVTPNAKGVQRIPVADFEVVHKIRPQYVNRHINRASIRQITRFSKYIISILHWIKAGDEK